MKRSSKLSSWQKRNQLNLALREQKSLVGVITDGENEMVETRIISGVVTSWETKSGAKGEYLTGIIDEKQYNFFKPKNSTLKASYLDVAPEGSTVEFTQTKNGQYWNVKEGTFKLISKSELKVDEVKTTSSSKQFTSDNYWKNKDARDEANQPIWQYLNAAQSAATALNGSGNFTNDVLLKLADDIFKKAQDIKRKAVEAKKIEEALKKKEELEKKMEQMKKELESQDFSGADELSPEEELI